MTHIPDQIDGSIISDGFVEDCACEVHGDRLFRCSLHKAAPDLLETLVITIIAVEDWLNPERDSSVSREVLQRMQKHLAATIALARP